MVECKKISVDSVHNDPVDIRCGGPDYLGFDFFVKKEEATEMASFIADTLDKYGVPLAGLNVYGNIHMLAEDKVWTKKRIEACIKKDADYLIRESKTSYGRSYKKR